MEAFLSTGLFILGCYVLALVTWLFYLAAMNLIKIREQLTGLAKVNGYILVTIGIVLDVAVNFILGTIIFVEIPREWLLTDRLQRHKRKPKTNWRYKIANYVCTNLLNPFDPGHC